MQVAWLGTTPSGHIGDQIADHIGGYACSPVGATPGDHLPHDLHRGKRVRLALECQGAWESGFEVYYSDPFRRNGDTGHGLPPESAYPGWALLRPEISRCR
jgi:hypothetical protein